MKIESNADELPDPLAGRHAGFWLRFLASIIDMVLYSPIYFAIRGVLGYNHLLLAEVTFAVFAIVTYAAFFSSKWHASPGLKLLGIRVVDRQGQYITYAQSIKWGIISSIGVVICFAGFFYMQYRFDLYGVLQLIQSCYEEKVLMEDCVAEINNLIEVPYETFIMMLRASSVLSLFLLVIWSLSVALTRDKSGFHNLVCNTRFIQR